MGIFFGILGIVIFLGGSYFLGNKAFDSFDEDRMEQLSNTLFVMLLMFVLLLVICHFSYHN